MTPQKANRKPLTTKGFRFCLVFGWDQLIPKNLLQSKYLDWAEGLEVGGVEVLYVAEDAADVGAVLDPFLLSSLHVVKSEGLRYFEDLLVTRFSDAELAVVDVAVEHASS